MSVDALQVAAGGALGALARWGVQRWLAGRWPDYPAGTLAVNLAGCLAIGVLLPLVGRLHEATRPLVIVGFLGGLTTMSSYAVEVVTLAGEGRQTAAVLHWAGGAVLCVAVCAAGYLVGVRLGR